MNDTDVTARVLGVSAVAIAAVSLLISWLGYRRSGARVVARAGCEARTSYTMGPLDCEVLAVYATNLGMATI